MIKIKLGDINNILYNMKELVNKDVQIKTAYKLSKLLKILDNENQTFEEQKVKLFQKYGEKDDNGELKVLVDGKVDIDKKNIRLFNAEFTDLYNIEIEIQFEPIKLEDLEDIKLSTMVLYNLNEFIVE